MEKKVGAVMVIGSGIGGIQASLDLAELGFKVYLVENAPSIGGRMPQLDKTFPTNDCAMCILAPKLVDSGRHPNIEIITQAEIEGLRGEAGNFTVSIRKRPRYVDLLRCTGCSECERVCPVEVRSRFNEGLDTRHAIYRLYPQAIPNAFTIEKIDAKSPCKVACPAKVNAQGYIQLISQGRFKEALDLVRERNPFPGICGRVCHHPCEKECLRGGIDSPVAIRNLKRFLADYELSHGGSTTSKPQVPTFKKKVAVIGGGPAGLTAAYDLRRFGYNVSVFEKEDGLGGMMRFGIPAYRLPREILKKEIDAIIDSGIEVKLGIEIGKDLKIDELRKEFNAVLIATGAGLPKGLGIEGADKEGVFLGIPFLRAVNKGERVDIGKRVLVIGGGNVAIDCARASLRLGASQVHLACLEAKEEMPAHPWEIDEAVEEGVIIHTRIGPKQVLGNSRVNGLQVLKVKQVFDEQGRFSPVFDEEKEDILDCDTLIIAIGQEPDLSFLDGIGIEKTRKTTIATHPITLSTNLEGVFACGDVTKGPASVIEAIAQGHEAAISIDRYLRGEDLKEGRKKEEGDIVREVLREVKKEKREEPPRLEVKKRILGFDEIEGCFTEEEAIKEAKRCLSCSVCSECMECVKVCKADAINHEMKEEILELNVGSIILAPGFDRFDPKLRSEYGYGRFKNVVTSLEFERILSASGPFRGHIKRLSDGKTPKRIAWIQCVGSRDPSSGYQYCSSVCCMYATKEAVIAKEHEKGLDCTIFFMDMRCFGKGFERYYSRAKEEYGVRYRRGRISSIEELQETKDLRVRYESEDGKVMEEDYNMVVLSVGMRPPDGLEEIYKILGIKKNKYGFIKTNDFSPVTTTRDGIYVCGVGASPKDIPETVTEASAAVSEVSVLLSDVRGMLIKEKAYPEEIDVREQEPRIGVFICRCGINIGGIIDVQEVVEYAKLLPDVIHVEENLFTCSQDTQERIKKMIKEHGLNRVLIASCTPRSHEPLFQDTIREAGLNPYLLEFVNIRDQCSWVHMNEKDEATKKAKDLVKMGIGRARLLKPIRPVSIPVVHKGLVIGGGLSGLCASLVLAEHGFEVYLVEKGNELGGNLRHIYYTLNGGNPQRLLQDMIERVYAKRLIHVYKNSKILETKGFLGNYKTKIKVGDETIELEHGVTIVATGADEYKPTEYLYGQDERVITQLELEEKIVKSQISDLRSVVMIQCVESRSYRRPYCSRVCCTQAIKNALRLKDLKQDTEIYILYRDIRSYGFMEEYYTMAREAGVLFIRYDEENKPQVRLNSVSSQLEVEVFDPILQRRLMINPDLIVLSTGVASGKNNEELAKILKVPLTLDGFFLEAHPKLRPLEFATDGIFLAGLAHSPRFIDEAISQAKAAAVKAAILLTKTHIEAKGIIVSVNEKWCSGCGICVSICPYDAREIDPDARVARVRDVLCQGCGACSAVCPSGATEQRGFEKRQILEMVDAIV